MMSDDPLHTSDEDDNCILELNTDDLLTDAEDESKGIAAATASAQLQKTAADTKTKEAGSAAISALSPETPTNTAAATSARTATPKESPAPAPLAAPDQQYTEFHYGPDPFNSELREEYGAATPSHPCRPCKQRLNRIIRHKHHSTSYFYEKSVGSDINCPSCKIRHPKLLDQPRVALYTTSTLHNFFLDPAVRTPFHIDIESICSGKYVDLYNAWRYTHQNVTGPVNILVLAGINDIMSTPIKGFESLLKSWSYDVSEQDPKSSIRFLKPPQPPMFVWFEQNGALPSPDYVNYIEKVSKMNEVIDDVNRSNGHSNVVGFSYDGCRSKKHRRDGQTIISHCFGSWRELYRGKSACLHLNDYKRLVMARKLFRYIGHKILATVHE